VAHVTMLSEVGQKVFLPTPCRVPHAVHKQQRCGM
jgi:hypothetical protein